MQAYNRITEYYKVLQDIHPHHVTVYLANTNIPFSSLLWNCQYMSGSLASDAVFNNRNVDIIKSEIAKKCNSYF